VNVLKNIKSKAFSGLWLLGCILLPSQYWLHSLSKFNHHGRDVAPQVICRLCWWLFVAVPWFPASFSSYLSVCECRYPSFFRVLGQNT
jgi:hypothetical protein